MAVTDEKFAARAAELYASPEALRAFNEDIVSQFRANAGQVVSGPLTGAPLLLLTLADGEEPIPLAYISDGDRLVIVASKGGVAEHPSWYGSLKAHPIGAVEVGTETLRVRATEVSGAERDRLYAAVAARMPIFNVYAERTSRVIPVLVLERLTDSASGEAVSRSG